MSMFGRIEGKVYGDWTWVGDKNRALVALSLAKQARETLDQVEHNERLITIFAGRKRGREYMGWRTGRDESLNVVEEAIV